MPDTEPLRRPGPSFSNWCSLQRAHWRELREAPERWDKEQSKEFCQNMMDRYTRALQRAREGFRCRLT